MSMMEIKDKQVTINPDKKQEIAITKNGNEFLLNSIRGIGSVNLNDAVDNALASFTTPRTS